MPMPRAVPMPSPTLVALDIGNSSVDIAAFTPVPAHPTLPIPHWRVKLPVRQLGPPDTDLPQETRTLLNQLRQRDLAAPWYVASVNRKALSVLEQWSGDVGLPLQILAPADFPIALDVRQPERVGLDRRAAALAGNRLRREQMPLLILDVGTAITINLIDARGHFQGGAIMPGMRLAAQALAQGTDRLPDLEDPIVPPESPLGRDTQEAMRAGIFYGALGGIHELVTQLTALAPQAPVDVLLTGGAADMLAAHLRFPLTRHPDLVLAGIALAATQHDGSSLSPAPG